MLTGIFRRSAARQTRAASSYAEVWSFISRRYALPSRNLPQCAHVRSLTSTTRLGSLFERSPEEYNGLLDTYKKSLTFPAATHEIRDLDVPSLEGTEVVLHGYLGNRSDLSKNLFFVPLISHDLNHSIQIISSAKADRRESALRAHEQLRRHGQQTPVVITGRLKPRKPAANKDAKDKDEIVRIESLEVDLLDAQVLNTMPKDINLSPEAVFTPEQRHLQIRRDKSIRDALAFRSEAARECRSYLQKKLGFVEVETPLLFKSTPEGAREFIVPTRREGLAYALPQSPQQFKQVLMGSGIHRYFQLARCFRDEDLRADRQPEFTQLDLEMSFASGEDVMKVMTAMTQHLWKTMLQIELPAQFPEMTYAEAMSRYGIDKPDVRYDMHLRRVDHLLPVDLVKKISPLTMPVVDAMVLSPDGPAEPTQTRRLVGDFLDSKDAEVFHQNPDGGPGIFIYDSSKPLSGLQPLGFEAAEEFESLYDLKDGDLIILQARKDAPFSGGSIPLGNLRVALHREAIRQGLVSEPQGFKPLWITNFPLFSPVSENEPGQGGAAGLASTHHPFTSPKTAEDVDMLLENPSEVIGEHYDLVMNGVELGGGSRRIHNADLQQLIMEEVLQMDPDRIAEFSHLLEVLRAGCPPHAGIALGFDRLIATMLGRPSVRDVIAFPKSGSGEDMLMKSPGQLTEDQLETYHLQLRKDQAV